MLQICLHFISNFAGTSYKKFKTDAGHKILFHKDNRFRYSYFTVRVTMNNSPDHHSIERIMIIGVTTNI